MQLALLPVPEERETEAAIRQHISICLEACRATDESRGFSTTADDDYCFEELEAQSRRCAITANVLSSLPNQLNTMR